MDAFLKPPTRLSEKLADQNDALSGAIAADVVNGHDGALDEGNGWVLDRKLVEKHRTVLGDADITRSTD